MYRVNAEYVSNTAAGSLNNNIILFGERKTAIYRSFFKLEQYGVFSYVFWFSNNVFSTFEEGAKAYPDRKGGSYTITNAKIGACEKAEAYPLIKNEIAVTFDDKTEKEVLPGEEFFSDPLPFCVDSGYLMFEYTITGSELPCTEDSQIPCFADYGQGFIESLLCPKPSLVGCDRKVKKRIAFIGDSITQGCATRNDCYEHWVAQISQMLGEAYSVWNIGLGYARAHDAAFGECWQRQAENADITAICLGVNDILHWNGINKGGAKPEEVTNSIELLVSRLSSRNINVILFNVPPFNLYDIGEEDTWREVNKKIPLIAEKYGVKFFDIAKVLSNAPPHDASAKYGPHPDGGGGNAVARAFIEQRERFGL